MSGIRRMETKEFCFWRQSWRHTAVPSRLELHKAYVSRHILYIMLNIETVDGVHPRP
jgi:hypothetical protein